MNALLTRTLLAVSLACVTIAGFADRIDAAPRYHGNTQTSGAARNETASALTTVIMTNTATRMSGIGQEGKPTKSSRGCADPTRERASDDQCKKPLR